MLMQLLDNVEALHAAQPRDVNTHGPQPRSLNSVENVRPPTDTGYEPEGQAGTSSTGDRSDFFSNNSSRQADHWGSGRRESGNRVSTVMEGDEDFEQPETYQHNVSSPLPAPGPPHLSPSREVDANRDIAQAGGAAFTTPPRPTQPNKPTSSIKNTPRSSLSDKTNRRNKSLSSSFFPKFSRWSKTTASSIGDNFRRDSATTTHTARPPPTPRLLHPAKRLMPTQRTILTVMTASARRAPLSMINLTHTVSSFKMMRTARLPH
jgi:hypothetical protein